MRDQLHLMVMHRKNLAMLACSLCWHCLVRPWYNPLRMSGHTLKLSAAIAGRTYCAVDAMHALVNVDVTEVTAGLQLTNLGHTRKIPSAIALLMVVVAQVDRILKAFSRKSFQHVLMDIKKEWSSETSNNLANNTLMNDWRSEGWNMSARMLLLHAFPFSCYPLRSVDAQPWQAACYS